MTIIEYRGHKITPASYEHGDMPAHWFPLAIVETPDGESKPVALPPKRGIEQSEADSEAVRRAKQRIALNNL